MKNNLILSRNELCRSRRTQVFSLDMIFAMIMFIFILIGTFWAWHITEDRINYIKNSRDMNIEAKNAINNLVNKHGDPIHWEYLEDINLVESFGLLEQQKGITSSDKVDRLVYFVNSSYNESKDLLGIRSSNFLLEIGDTDVGLVPTNPSLVVVAERAMLLTNSSTISIKLRLWR